MCQADINDKYKFCLKCSQSLKQTNQEVGAIKTNNDDVVKALGAVNNNLYALRKIQEAILEKEYKLILRWDKDTSQFMIEKKLVKK